MTGSLFLAIEPDDQTRSLLAQMLAPFGADDRLPGGLSPPANWHMTVRFLGPIDEVMTDRLIAALDQAELPGPFPVKLSGFGAFPRADKASVLWVAVESNGLGFLATVVEEVAVGLGLDQEERPYVPHLTLSRIRPPRDVSELLADKWGRLTFTIDRLTLFRSVRVEADEFNRSEESNGERDRSGLRYLAVEAFSL